MSNSEGEGKGERQSHKQLESRFSSQKVPLLGVSPATPRSKVTEEGIQNEESCVDDQKIRHPTQWKHLNTNERITIFISLVTLVVGGLGLWNSYSNQDTSKAVGELASMEAEDRHQTGIMQSQLTTMESQTSALQNEVNAIQDQTTAMNGMSKNQLRAYLSVVPGNISEENGKIDTWVNLSNKGLTPAINIDTVQQIEYLRPGDPIYCKIEGHEKTSSIIGPGQTFFSGTTGHNSIQIDADEIDSLDEDKAAIFAAGHVDYDDIYGKRWRQNFCFYFRGKDWRTAPGLFWRVGNSSEPYYKKN